MTRVGSEVIRPILRSLDDMPVHVRQLAAMFRKHRGVLRHSDGTIKDLDATEVPSSLRDGWKKDSWHTPDRVVGSAKRNRAHPTEYLEADYIRQHMARFDGGATRFYRSDSLGKYGPGNQGTTFVFPTSEIDNIIAQADTPQELGRMLGLGEDFFVDAAGNAVSVQRADFSYEELVNGNLRLPRGNEGGANEYWVPGGFLPGADSAGIPEGVFNVHPDATGRDPSVSGTWGRFEDYVFDAP